MHGGVVDNRASTLSIDTAAVVDILRSLTVGVCCRCGSNVTEADAWTHVGEPTTYPPDVPVMHVHCNQKQGDDDAR